MAKLKAQFAPSFKRDLKRLDKKHVDDKPDDKPLEEVVSLIIENTPEALETLRQRHKTHHLGGAWSNSIECHIGNVGDWLLIWRVFDGIALLP